MIVWVLEKNQSVVGIGTVGFNICDMPWDPEKLEEDKKFIISVLNGIRNRMGWETIDYSPNQEMLKSCIDKFESLVLKMTKNDINIQAINDWLNESTSDDLGFQSVIYTRFYYP